MMYRLSSFFRSAKNFKQVAAAATQNIVEATAEAAVSMFVQLGIMERAERENRQRNRFIKRHSRYVSYDANGLNGPRAMARRRRQIAAGSLRVENGLVS